MVALPLPEAFLQAYAERQNYPINLKSFDNIYPWKLKSYKRTLDRLQASMCEADERKVELPIIDLHTPSRDEIAVLDHQVGTSEALSHHLGLQHTVGQNADSSVLVTTKKDPECRLLYVYGQHSRGHLKVTKEMLAQLLTYHQVTPAFLDFMFAFGAQAGARDISFSSFQSQLNIQDSATQLSIRNLDRSGRRLQLCYNLHGVSQIVEDTEAAKNQQWSIRQTAVHHQFDVVHGKSLWIIVKGRRDLLERFQSLHRADPCSDGIRYGDLRERFLATLAIHLMYCHWATEDWRWLMLWLDDVLVEARTLAIYDALEFSSVGREEELEHMEDLQFWQTKARDAVQALEANISVMTALQKFYMALESHPDFPLIFQQECKADIQHFVSEVQGIKDNLTMVVSRGRLIEESIRERKALVVHHLQEQSNERTKQLNEGMKKEAVRMRMITIVTLVYLPATFVSTFFSTDVYRYSNDTGVTVPTEQFSSEALTKWFEFTGPLTIFTMLVALIACKGRLPSRMPRWRWKRVQLLPLSFPPSWRFWQKSPSLPSYNEKIAD